METRYVVDAADRIESFVTDALPEPTDASQTWMGRSLWSVVSGDATRQIYRQLLRRVRLGRSEVSFRYRCDLAHQRRWFEMSVRGVQGDRVEFCSRLLSTSVRPPISWLESVTGCGPAIVLCSWCGEVLHEGEWREIEQVAPEVPDSARVEHGICPTCATKFMAQFGESQK